MRRTIVWDEENRVRAISDNGRTTRFVYDDGGNRIIKTGAQGETVYVNDKWTIRNRSIGTKHIYVGTTRIASKLSPGDAHVRPDEHDLVSQMLGRWWEHRSDSGNDHGSNTDKNPHYQVPSSMPERGQPDTNFVYFYHPDHLGNTSYTTDTEGELYEHVQYFPSGELWVDQRSNTERLPYLFGSKELDQETGLYYFGARYYDPRVGLWASTDPAQTSYLSGGGSGGVYTPINLATYTYAAHNPLILYDPDGRSWWSKTLDWVQGGLDVVSVAMDATGVGAAVSWAPDLINAGISAGRGDWAGAGLSAAAAIPFIGATANATRLGRTVAKNADEAAGLVRTADHANDARKAEKGLDAASAGRGGNGAGSSGGGGSGGRGSNNLKPDPAAEGPHSTFKTDAQGRVTGHAEWTPNPRNPSGFDQVKRVDTQYAHPHEHNGVPTPHVHDKSVPGKVRPANPDELPK